jgi:hypothetical protein
MLVRTDIRAIRRDNTMLIMKDGRMVMSSDTRAVGMGADQRPERAWPCRPRIADGP